MSKAEKIAKRDKQKAKEKAKAFLDEYLALVERTGHRAGYDNFGNLIVVFRPTGENFSLDYLGEK